MKRILCSLLVLSLLCAGVALADTNITTDGGTGETTLTYTVPEPESNYTVIIPADVKFAEEQTSTTMQISIEAGSTLAKDKRLDVSLSDTQNFYRLLNGDNEIEYQIWKDDITVSAGSKVLSWTAGEAIPEATTLTMKITSSMEGLPAGDYTDRLTFKVALNDVTTGGTTGEDFEDGGSLG